MHAVLIPRALPTAVLLSTSCAQQVDNGTTSATVFASWRVECDTPPAVVPRV
jgi:hypothetical protein